MSRFLSSIGISFTIVYIAGLWWLFDARLDDIKHMEPNEIGDFLAGVFGPLSILWLILGFFQQGVELRQNTNALELQAKELRNSVEQQKKLVKVSSSTLNLQSQEIKNSKDESKRNDIHRLIEKLAERINKNYRKEIELNNGSETYLIPLSTALSSDDKNRRQTISRIHIELENRLSSAFTTIFAIENDLKRLCEYIELYQTLNQYNDYTMKDFYKAEFEDLISSLMDHGWITNTDTEKILFKFLFTN